MSVGSGRWDVFSSYKRSFVDYSLALVSRQVRGRDVSFRIFVINLILRLYWCKGLISLFVFSFVQDGDWDKSKFLFSFLKRSLTLIVKVLIFSHYLYRFMCMIMITVCMRSLWRQVRSVMPRVTLGCGIKCRDGSMIVSRVEKGVNSWKSALITSKVMEIKAIEFNRHHLLHRRGLHPEELLEEEQTSIMQSLVIKSKRIIQMLSLLWSMSLLFMFMIF